MVVLYVKVERKVIKMYIMVKFSSLFGSLSVSRLALSVNLSKICNVVDNALFFRRAPFKSPNC